VGPVGPTQPSGYYFDLTVTPNALFVGGGVQSSVNVRDSHGNAVGGASVVITVSGIDAFDAAGLAITTNANGQGSMWMEYKGVGIGGLSFFTATLENRSLTAPVQLIAPGQ